MDTIYDFTKSESRCCINIIQNMVRYIGNPICESCFTNKYYNTIKHEHYISIVVQYILIIIRYKIYNQE